MFGKLHHLSQGLFSSKVYVQADQFKLKRQVSVVPCWPRCYSWYFVNMIQTGAEGWTKWPPQIDTPFGPNTWFSQSINTSFQPPMTATLAWWFSVGGSASAKQCRPPQRSIAFARCCSWYNVLFPKELLMAHCARFIRFGPSTFWQREETAQEHYRGAQCTSYPSSRTASGWKWKSPATQRLEWSGMWDRALRKMSTCDLHDQENGGKNTSDLIVLPVIPTPTKYLTKFLAYHLTFWHITWQFIFGMHILPFYLTFFLANSLTFFLASYLLSILAFYLTSILAYILTFFLAYVVIYFLRILSGILAGMRSGTLSAILFSIYSDILSGILSGIMYSDIFSAILSGIYADVLSAILSGIFSHIFLPNISRTLAGISVRYSGNAPRLSRSSL